MRKLHCLLALAGITGLAAAQPPLHLKTLKRDLPAVPSAVDALAKSRSPSRSHFLVQFAGNPTGDQLSQLTNRGARILSYVPDFGYSISAERGTSFESLGIRSAGALQAEEKISPDLAPMLEDGAAVSVIAEFYSDVDRNDARAIVIQAGALIEENPDLLWNHLLLSATAEQIAELARWDEVAYIFPAAMELTAGTPSRGCAGALTTQGAVGQSVALVGDGWDGPGKGGAELNYAWARLAEKLPEDSTQAEIVRALNEWAKYARLKFAPAGSYSEAKTIAVTFASGDHGDGYPFDGPGGVLAHTFYPFPVNPEPIAGDMHLDNDESWKIGADVDVFSIALHEAGHALGLGHSDKPGAVMYPYYHKAVGLTQEDITAILQLYAAQDGAPDPGTPVPKPGTPSDTPATPLTLTVQVPSSPTTLLSTAISGAVSGGAGRAQVTWTTDHGYSGMAVGAPNWTIASVPLILGENVITITARDSQQNQVSRIFAVTRQQSGPNPGNPATGPDTTPPSLTILSPATTNYSTSASSLAVTGTAQDNVGVAAVTWASSNGDSGTAAGTSNWSTPPVPLYIGTTTITIRARDAAGNTSWRSLTVTRH